MQNLTFVPLAREPERAVSFLPDSYLKEVYALGLKELKVALDVNVLGLDFRPSETAPNKWFGSEFYLATLLSEIMKREPNCEILEDKYREALDKVTKCSKSPCWLQNTDSYNNQKYALVAYDAHRRIVKRFIGLPSRGFVVSTICEESGCFSPRRDEATFIEWAKMGDHRSIINGFWSKQAFRRMMRALYEQSYSAFLRRGPFHRQYSNFDLTDSASGRYKHPQVVRQSRFHENLSYRLRKLGVEPLNEYGWRTAESNEERDNLPTRVSFTMTGTDTNRTQGESRIHRSGVTRQDMLDVNFDQMEECSGASAESAIQARQALSDAERAVECAATMRERHAAERVAELGEALDRVPALDEFTEACATVSSAISDVANSQNVSRQQLAEEMRTAQPPDRVRHTSSYQAYIDDLHGRNFDLLYRASNCEPDGEAPVEDESDEPVFDESCSLDRDRVPVDWDAARARVARVSSMPSEWIGHQRDLSG